MAYKFSIGDYQHSGSLQATVDITGSTTVSGAVGQFGTLTVATFSPANISATNITASTNVSASTANIGTLTVGTFSPTNLTVTNDLVVSGNTTLGNLISADLTVFNSKVSSSLLPTVSQNLGDPGGNDLWKVYASTISGSSTLQVGGTSTLQAVNAQAVTATTLSASSNAQVGGALTVAGATTLNGNLTVNGVITYVSSSVVEFKDVNLIIASGTTTSLQANGAGLTVGNTGYQLKFVSGSSGTSGDSWQFSGSTGLTDFSAGNITGTSFQGPLKETNETTSITNTAISKLITFANATGSMVVNLPAAGASNSGYTYKVKNVGTFPVTVKSLGGTIDGADAATGVTLATQYAAASFVSNGSNWFVF
jgi:hypothetical protein